MISLHTVVHGLPCRLLGACCNYCCMTLPSPNKILGQAVLSAPKDQVSHDLKEMRKTHDNISETLT